MKSFLLSMLLCLLAVPAVRGEKAPLSTEELVQEAELIVVGHVESLNINVGPSRHEPGHGNEDWVIDATIKVDSGRRDMEERTHRRPMHPWQVAGQSARFRFAERPPADS